MTKHRIAPDGHLHPVICVDAVGLSNHNTTLCIRRPPRAVIHDVARDCAIVAAIHTNPRAGGVVDHVVMYVDMVAAPDCNAAP